MYTDDFNTTVHTHYIIDLLPRTVTTIYPQILLKRQSTALTTLSHLKLTAPVIKLDPSARRNRTGALNSSGLLILLSIFCFSHCSTNPLSFAAPVIGVSIWPGLSVFTRMGGYAFRPSSSSGLGFASPGVRPGKVFCGWPHSAARERASWCIADFAALYGAVLIPYRINV
jgi:hypothetical protein